MRRSTRRRCTGMVLLAPAYNRTAAAAAPALPSAGSGLQHAVAHRVHRELGSPGGLPEPVRSRRARRRLGRHARVRSGRRDVGHRRAPRAVDHDVGLERRDDRRARRSRRCSSPPRTTSRFPARSRAACDDMGATDKVFVDLARAAHSAHARERNVTLLSVYGCVRETCVPRLPQRTEARDTQERRDQDLAFDQSKSNP